jgi:hypothetical protein
LENFAMRDLFNNLNLKRGISPQIQTNADTAFVSQILDTLGLNGAVFALLTGALTDANATFVVLAEEGDDSGLSDNTAIADANLLGTEALAAPLFSDDNKCFKLGIINNKRYVRVTVTPSGNNSGDINLGGVWITEPFAKPTANPPA